jgi:MFS family permease
MGGCLALGRSLDRSHPFTRQYGARFALQILSSINLLNFADRYVPAAVKTLIQEDLHINDFESSLPATGMIVVFMTFAVVFGVLSDKDVMDRRVMLCVAVIAWSLATAAAGFATSLVQLIAFRSLIGVGEAAYGTYMIAFLNIK